MPFTCSPSPGCKSERAPLPSLARRAAVRAGRALLGSVCVEEKNIFHWWYGEGKGEEWVERQWLWKGSVAFLAQTVAERRETVSSIERVEGPQGG